jgi:RsiW-degrading membrane proteinase PrsW (M82 family)
VGGAISAACAGILNDLFSHFLGVGEELRAPFSHGSANGNSMALLALFVGINEELCKVLATLFVARRYGDLNEPVDALIYAMVVALGFAVFENLLYVSLYGSTVLLPRYLTAVPLHITLALIWGCGLAKGRFSKPASPVLWIMTPSIIAASLLHAGYDYVLFMQYYWAGLIALPGLIALLAYANQRLKKMARESPFPAAGFCFQCHHQNPPLANFCGACGNTLAQALYKVCVSCKQRIAHHANFCSVCGARCDDG